MLLLAEELKDASIEQGLLETSGYEFRSTLPQNGEVYAMTSNLRYDK